MTLAEAKKCLWYFPGSINKRDTDHTDTDTWTQVIYCSPHCTVHSAMQVLSERTMIVSDMKAQMDPRQDGKQRQTSIQHYIIKRTNQNWTSVDKHSRVEVNSVFDLFVYRKYAYSRRCHTLGVNLFIISPGPQIWQSQFLFFICRCQFLKLSIS